MPNTVAASATALPSAQIIHFPIEQAAGEFNLTYKDWTRFFDTLTIADEFTGMDDAEIDVTLREMLQSPGAPDQNGVHYLVRRNGEVLESLRKAIGFLSVMDRRLMAAAHRVLDDKAVR
jgi:hypothetical protein